MHDPERLLVLAHEMEAPRERHLKWKHIAERYEKGRHSALARIVQRIRDTSPEKKSQAQLESEALASKEWAEYENNMNDAKQHEITYQVQIDNLQCEWESLRSYCAAMRDGFRQGVV